MCGEVEEEGEKKGREEVEDWKEGKEEREDGNRRKGEMSRKRMTRKEGGEGGWEQEKEGDE